MNKKNIVYADDDYESIGTLTKLRAPALIAGLVLGLAISFVTSGFEKVLATDIHVAYFLPFIVYIAAAVGSQTQTIYTRSLITGKAKFHIYLAKETALGIAFGLVFGLVSGLIAYLWLGKQQLAMGVGLATLCAIALAPIIALIITQLFQFFREDPAAGSGPITTVIQDMVSIIVYGLICSLILL